MGVADRIRAMRRSTAPHIRVERVSKRFGRLRALDGLSFQVDEPSVVGLVGPNGCGKTTLIRCLLGLAKPSEGRIRVNDRPPAPWRRAGEPLVGYMPQVEAVYPELTVRRNVDFFARIYRVPRRERSGRIQSALELAHLADRADDRVATLSGGLRRRASLACALVHDPQLLFLDEPTVGIDPLLRASMWKTFHELRDRGSLLFLSTHYMEEAERCDRVLLMRDGRALAFDAPKKILRRTRTRRLEDAFLKLLGREAEP